MLKNLKEMKKILYELNGVGSDLGIKFKLSDIEYEKIINKQDKEFNVMEAINGIINLTKNIKLKNNDKILFNKINAVRNNFNSNSKKLQREFINSNIYKKYVETYSDMIVEILSNYDNNKLQIFKNKLIQYKIVSSMMNYFVSMSEFL